MKTAVQFGAGNIGRGFTGELFSEAGYEVVFVDVVPSVVEALNRDREYIITIAKDPEEYVRVVNVRAVNGIDIESVAEEIANCEIAATAVGVNVLAAVAGPISEGIKRRKAKRPDSYLNFIICENMRDAAGALRELVNQKLDDETCSWAEKQIGFTQAVVGRMVPVRTDKEIADNPLGVRVEPYRILPVDRDSAVGPLPEIPGIVWKSNFQAYIDQKLFAHNLGHAVSAYFGALKGLVYIWECMEDVWVRSHTEKAMQETGEALIKRYGIDPNEHQAHIEDLLNRFSNKKLGDTVARVGGDPLRKLGPEDRLIGAAHFCIEQGVLPVYVCKAIAAGLKYRNEEDTSSLDVQKIISQKGIEQALTEICGLKQDDPIRQMVLKEYAALQVM